MAALRMRFEPGDIDAARPTIDELVKRFRHWCRANGSSADAWDLDLLLDWKVTWSDGRLDDWLVGDVEQFLLDWCPRKLSAPADIALPMADSVATAFMFFGEAGLLAADSDPGTVLARHARSLGPEFQVQMADPANFGMAKTLFSGIDPEDLTEETLDALMTDFNALPLEQRQAMTERLMPDERMDPDIRIGPFVLPGEDEVRESAAQAPVLAGFRKLAEFFAEPGRKLTAKGNIRLADAQALSEILGTEPLEQTLGDFTLRRHSSANMPALDHWQWWAREAGALRVTKGRLVGVRAWEKRCQRDPVGEARKAYRTLMDYGVVESYLPRRWMGDDVLGEMVGPLLTLMLTSDSPVQFRTLTDAVGKVRRAMGVPMMFGNPEYEFRLIASEVDTMLTLLERAGVLVQHDIVHEQGPYTDDRTGGTVELTPFGVGMAVEEARESGLIVQTIDSPGDLSAAMLAELAVQQDLSPEEWSQVVADWLVEQPDRGRAVNDLMDITVAAGGAVVMMELAVPEQLLDDVVGALRTMVDMLPRDDLRSAVAFSWLLGQNLVNLMDVDRESALMSHLTALGIVAESYPEEIPGFTGLAGSREEALETVARASRMAPGNVEFLLEAVGKHHPDKVVAKSARRELLRVRSRRANQPRP